MKFSELFSDVDGRLGLIAQLAMFFAAASANQTVEQSRLSKGTGLMCRPLPVIVHIKLALASVYIQTNVFIFYSNVIGVDLAFSIKMKTQTQ